MKRMTRNLTRKSHSWWWNSHISPKNSKWLAENLEKMDTLVKEMLKLIEEEGDSFASKAEMYYKRRPELVQHVEDFYRMYRALAERYDHITGELRKTVPSELQSQSSTGSDITSEPKNGSDSSSSSSETDSESDDAKENDNDLASELQQRIVELENELKNVKEKREGEEVGDYENLRSKISSLEAELAAADENLRAKERLEEKITALESDVFHYKNETRSLQMSIDEIAKEHEANILNRDQAIVEYKMELLRASEMHSQEKSKLEAESTRLDAAVQQLNAEVRAISEEKLLLEARVLEQEHVITEIRSKAASSADRFCMEMSELEDKLRSVSQSNDSLELKLQKFDNEIKLLEEEKAKLLESDHKSEKENLTIRINDLTNDIKDRDVQLSQMGKHLHQLHLEHLKLIKDIEEEQKIGNNLRSRVKQLEDEVEKQRAIINDGAEGKREAIRQLCFSLEHYQDGYRQLRQVLMGHKKFAVTAT